MSAPSLWYFAYGSNLARGTFLGRRRMRPLAWQRARLDGYALVFDLPVGRGARGVANVRRDPASHVHGVAWRISGAGAAFLDSTEGVQFGAYARLPVVLTLENGAPLRGYTYASHRGRAGRKPSARYLGLLLRGAREHGLSPEWIEHLRAFELATDERHAQLQLPL